MTATRRGRALHSLAVAALAFLYAWLWCAALVPMVVVHAVLAVLWSIAFLVVEVRNAPMQAPDRCRLHEEA